jgi:hypothetical protein
MRPAAATVISLAAANAEAIIYRHIRALGCGWHAGACSWQHAPMRRRTTSTGDKCSDANATASAAAVLKSALRQLYLRVHPDLFQNQPSAQAR